MAWGRVTLIKKTNNKPEKMRKNYVSRQKKVFWSNKTLLTLYIGFYDTTRDFCNFLRFTLLKKIKIK